MPPDTKAIEKKQKQQAVLAALLALCREHSIYLEIGNRCIDIYHDGSTGELEHLMQALSFRPYSQIWSPWD